jgi:hypothetical protein
MLDREEAKRRHAEAVLAYAEAAKPILDELKTIGIEVRSLQDMWKDRSAQDFDDRAVPVLIKWFRAVTHPRVKHTLAFALSRPQARAKALPVLIDEFRTWSGDENTRGDIGLAIAESFSKDRQEEIVSLVADRRYGRGRCGLLEAVRLLDRSVAVSVLEHAMMEEELVEQAIRLVHARHLGEAIPAILGAIDRFPAVRNRDNVKVAMEWIERSGFGKPRR